MGRPELPVDPAAGPVQRLAHDLRELRCSAGGVSYRTMAKKAGFSVTTLAKAASGERLPSLAVLQAYVRACGEDPAPWEARWAEAEAEALAREGKREDDDVAPPYRGLARFEPDDRELFFGRDRMVDELSELGCGSPFAVVFGASGSGKSSLLRAGLIPLLREKAAQQGRGAVLRILTPGARPATTYGHLLAPKADDPESWVVVDQFEEVFTLCRERAERDRFLDLLLAARDPGSRLRVLIAVRSDFYARCAEHPRLAEALHGSGLLVRSMTGDELREAVVGPAQAAGLIVERTLTARIVEDVLDEPGGLPMLSHALLETWRRRKGRMLTLAAYEAAGGVRGAIAVSAEEAYGELSPAQAHAARHLLLRMVEPGQGNSDTRRPLSWEEMAGWEDPEVRAVTRRLTQARLLITDDDGVQLAHEALITCWPRLREWIEADRERLRHHRQLTDAARTWLEHDRDPGTLFRGTRLARAEELFAGDDRGYDGLTSAETAFLVTAAEQRATEERAATRARRRSRTLTASLCAVLAVALIVGLTAVRLRQDSEKQTTDTAARRVAAVAEALRTTDPRTAMLLGVAAWRMSPLPESRRAVLGALAQPELDTFTDPAPGDEPNRYLDSSGRTLLSIGDNTWRTWDVSTHRRIASGPVPHGAILGAGPGGRVLVIRTAQQTQRLWDTRTRRWIGGPLPFWDTVRFGASGRNYLVRSPDDNRAGLYSVADGHLIFRTPSTGEDVAAAAADDGLLAVCPRGRTPQVWDTSARSVRPGAWTSVRGLCGGDRTLLAFTGGRLLGLAGDRVRVWDTASGRKLADVVHPGVVTAAVSADGSFLATGGGQEIRVWRMPNRGVPVFRHSLDNESLSRLAWDSSRPLLRYFEGGTVHTLDLTTTLTRAWRKSPLAGVRLSPDGRTLATAERIGERYVVQLRNTHDGRLLRTLPTPSLPAFSTGTATVPAEVTEPLLSFSPDGGTFAYGVSVPLGDTTSQRLTVWDVAAGHVKTTVDAATASATPTDAIALGPGGRSLLTAHSTEGGFVNEIWDTTRQRRTALLPGPGGDHLAVSRDGGLLVTDNRVVRAGRSHTHDLVQHDGIGAIAFAPDGSRLAAGDWTGRVALWDGSLRHRAGILRNVFPGPVNQSSDSAEVITALAFSPDGGTLAVGGNAGTVQLWDIATQQPLGPSVPTSGESIDTLAFSPDSTMLYAGGNYVPLQRYVVDPDQAVSLVCSRAGNRELTRAQWRTYVPDRPYRRVCT